MSEALLSARGLAKSYPGSKPGAPVTHVLAGVDMEIKRGESVAIIGPSGAGKTTLLYLLGGLARPTSGQVWLEGKELYALGDEGVSKLRNRKIGFIFQFHHLLPELTAAENVALPAMISGQAAGPSLAKAQTLLQEVGLSHRMGHKPGELSGGEQQRVAIARALSNGPDLILADEPTGNLDQATASGVHDLLMETCRQRRQALVLVTHNEGLAKRAGKVLKMQDGRFVF
jgi:lipoprotein-releasing system ATP-binding protein